MFVHTSAAALLVVITLHPGHEGGLPGIPPAPPHARAEVPDEPADDACTHVLTPEERNDIIAGQTGVVLNDRIEQDGQWGDLALVNGAAHWAFVRPNQVVYRKFQPGLGWGLEAVLAQGAEYDRVQVVALDNGAAWAAWVELDGAGASEVFAVKVVDGAAAGPAVNISNAAGQERQLAAATDGSEVWLAWVHDEGSSEIYLTRITAAEIVDPAVSLSGTSARDWAPDLALTSDGTVHVVWDSYLADNYDVYYRSYHPASGAGPLRAIAVGDEFQAHASIAADEFDGLWISWESAQADWGRGWLGNANSDWLNALDRNYWERNALHTNREAHLVRYEPGTHELMLPSVSLDDHVVERKLAALAMDYPLHDAPRVHCHGGRTYVVLRYAPFNAWPVRWQVDVTAVDDTNWYTLEPIDTSGGYLYQQVEAAGDGANLWLSGGRVGGEASGKVYAGSIPDTTVTPLTAITWTAVPGPDLPPEIVRTYDRHTIDVDSVTCTTYWGELHRHTELSADRWWIDGPVEEMYRYAGDVAKLDFIAQTDHGVPNGYMARHYPYMINQADLYTSGPLVAMYSYEWSPGRTEGVGHHNIISRAKHEYPGDVVVTTDELTDLSNVMGNLTPGVSIMIPHTTADTTDDANKLVHDWAIVRAAGLANPAFYRVVELFQGARTSYEYRDAPAPFGLETDDLADVGTIRTMLAEDIRMGFIAASDHWSNFYSFAVAYAEAPTRDAFFAALEARRCYGSTERGMILEFWVNDRPMGEEIQPASGTVPIRTYVRSAETVTEVTVMRDGFEWISVSHDASEFSGEWTEPDACGHSFYVRVRTENGHMAWSSPVWVDCPECTVDGDCDDGVFCNGAEMCGDEECMAGVNPCGGVPCDEENDQCLVDAAARLEAGSISVGGTAVTVPLAQSYAKPIVVCTVQYAANTVPVVPRVRNVTPTSFDLRLQNPSGAAVVEDVVHYIAMDEGAWVIDGVPCEAHRYTSTVTDSASSWTAQVQAYGQSYVSPVVLGQVLSENDSDWSVFWCQGSSRTSPPSPTELHTGKTVCEDPVTIRDDETVGFIVFEAGHAFINGVEFEAGVSAETVRGVGNQPPYAVPFAGGFAATPTIGVACLAGMNGGSNGGWGQLHGATAFDTANLYAAVDEDQTVDTERAHVEEQVGYAVFAAPVFYPPPPQCQGPADCDDQLFCTGVEDCVDGACVAGTDPCAGTGETCSELFGACVPPGPHVWMAFKDTVTIPGLGAMADEDMVAYHPASGTWSLIFDGSDVGLEALGVGAATRLASGEILLSFSTQGTVPGLVGGPDGELVAPADVVLFTPTSLGDTTAGVFTFHFDGSDVNLTTKGHNIDGLAVAADGRLIVSTSGTFGGTGATGGDEDLFVFNATSFGADTAGAFEVYFDGSDVGLADSDSEDLDAAGITPGGTILISTVGAFTVDAISGGGEDVLEFTPTSLGDETTGTWTVLLDLTALGIDAAANVGAVAWVE